jgi:hypothetical protein
MSLILALSFAELMQPGIPGSDRVAAELVLRHTFVLPLHVRRQSRRDREPQVFDARSGRKQKILP